MSEAQADGLNLAAEFPPVATAQWEAAIHADLKGADYEKRLVWRTEEGMNVKPYYRQEDLAGLEAQTDIAPGQFPSRAAAAPIGRSRRPQRSQPCVRGDRLHEQGATPSELAYALAAGVERLAACGEKGVPSTRPRAGDSIRLRRRFELLLRDRQAPRGAPPLGAGRRGLRPGEASALASIHAVTTLSNKSVCDPWTNLLRVDHRSARGRGGRLRRTDRAEPSVSRAAGR
jgi:methylmalonyl-CoA mutase